MNAVSEPFVMAEEPNSGDRAARNVDGKVVTAFGQEWSKLDQSHLDAAEYDELFESYFRIFPWDRLPPSAVGFDLGCGSGRWANGVARRVKTIHCIDPSAEALAVARRNLQGIQGVQFHQAAVDRIPLADASMDFGYCLGVLHHVPDTRAGLRAAIQKLKPGAPMLLYLYYAFDNQPGWFRALHSTSEMIRVTLSRSPFVIRYLMSQLIAGVVYWPLARAGRLAERLGFPVHSFPLSFYRNRSFYSMRTDALDRFGTRLEKRFTKAAIEEMMQAEGLSQIQFSDRPPYWCAVGIRVEP